MIDFNLRPIAHTPAPGSVRTHSMGNEPKPTAAPETPAQHQQRQSWAARNRVISRALHAAEAQTNNARVLHYLKQRSAPCRHADIATALGISKDWLRKTVLPRLAADGLVRRVTVSGATGWNLRYEWQAVTDNKEPQP
jgi:predicted DNA-binding transcriptional regulator